MHKNNQNGQVKNCFFTKSIPMNYYYSCRLQYSGKGTILVCFDFGKEVLLIPVLNIKRDCKRLLANQFLPKFSNNLGNSTWGSIKVLDIFTYRTNRTQNKSKYSANNFIFVKVISNFVKFYNGNNVILGIYYGSFPQ